MNPFKPGKAIIFYVENQLTGSKNDADNLKTRLESIGVDVTIVCLRSDDVGMNKGKQSNPKIIENEIERKIESPNYDAFEYAIVAFFAHGLDDDQLELGLYRFSLQKIILNKLFAIDALANKFKWVILQSCRGRIDAAKTDGPPSKSSQKYFIISYACQEGTVALRHEKLPENCSCFAIFIEYLCENLKQYARCKDLLSILNETRKSLKSKENVPQQNEDRGNLGDSRKFYFTKGIVENAPNLE